MSKDIDLLKQQAKDIIVKSAKEYEKRLANKNVIFITMKNNKEIEYIETLFLRDNFLHLTCVEINKSKMSAYDFFDSCITNKIVLDDFKFKKNNITDLKLKILPIIVTIDVTANILGDFDNNKLLLQTKKMAGNIRACMGFEYYKNMNIFIPNTALYEDIRNITNNRNRIVAILKKDKYSKFYDNITYIAKNINISEILSNDIIKSKIDFQKLHSDNVTYNNILSNL